MKYSIISCSYKVRLLALVCLTSYFILILPFLQSCGRGPEISIGVSQNSSDDWREKMNNEMLLEMYSHPEAELEIRSADNRNDLQISDIEYFIDKGVDVLVVSPREADAITPVIEKAHEAGIKVLVFDREMNGEAYDMFYGADNFKIGENAALYASRYLKPEHTASNPMRILEIRGLDGSSPAIGRHEGFRQEVDSNPRMQVIATVGTDWTPEPAASATDSILKLYPDVELIYAHNDRMAIAAGEKAKAIGHDNIKILGVDGAPKIGLRGIADGKIDATFVYPTNGGSIIQDAIDLANGEKKPKRDISESALAIDSSNVELQLLSARSLEEALDNVRTLNERVRAALRTRNQQQALIWALVGMLLIAAVSTFLILRLYWARKRTQEQLKIQNEVLRSQRDDLEDLNLRLNEATASKLNFFTNVSHDLRTPLTLISAPLEGLEEAPELLPHSKALVSVAQKNVRILQRLINQILDFQKFESGKLTLNLVSTDIIADIKEWTNAFRPSARKKDIRLNLEEKPEQPVIVAIDREKLERIFFNLMSNAFRFTPANGMITVSLSATEKDIILGIKDTGKGIPPENIPHLFERFFQGREGNAGGSGIGLVVVKSFVELHGGDITVESEPGKGTVFSVRLPKRTPEETAGLSEEVNVMESEDSEVISKEISDIEFPQSQEIVGEVGALGKPVVLVVDDNDDLRHLVRSILEPEYEVLTAPSGESGLRQAMRYVPDCVLTDVMMPGMNGLELTRRLKQETVTCHIPVIMLTACALDEQRASGYESGADGYLSKPFSRKVLLARIASAIANRRLLKATESSVVPLPDKSVVANATPGKEVKGRNVNPGASRKTGSADPFSELDSSFYREFAAMVEQGLEDPELNVEEMASRMGMSRVQFYRKLKALTNYSPADLLRLFRLRRAKELLVRDSETTVAEVAYKVGFSSPSYFAKCFKDQFGELPSELQARTAKIKG